jgi:hypothetical protein
LVRPAVAPPPKRPSGFIRFLSFFLSNSSDLSE